jgi:hypothetical protein
MIIHITKVEHKPTGKGGTLTTIYDEHKIRYSGFQKELHDIVEGDTLVAEIKQNGR